MVGRTGRGIAGVCGSPRAGGRRVCSRTSFTLGPGRNAAAGSPFVIGTLAVEVPGCSRPAASVAAVDKACRGRERRTGGVPGACSDSSLRTTRTALRDRCDSDCVRSGFACSAASLPMVARARCCACTVCQEVRRTRTLIAAPPNASIASPKSTPVPTIGSYGELVQFGTRICPYPLGKFGNRNSRVDRNRTLGEEPMLHGCRRYRSPYRSNGPCGPLRVRW
jgi:hypothetical protein